MNLVISSHIPLSLNVAHPVCHIQWQSYSNVLKKATRGTQSLQRIKVPRLLASNSALYSWLHHHHFLLRCHEGYSWRVTIVTIQGQRLFHSALLETQPEFKGSKYMRVVFDWWSNGKYIIIGIDCWSHLSKLSYVLNTYMKCKMGLKQIF